ncbi:DEAD/DEAH box helicase [Brevibacillus agri]|uniref:DEAD/DEAH box helicase n=1 Tax=Brevibacillus agri TaxID=51101 RepID=UPI002E1FE4FD|nr:DEAD/DEAH box helicase [Brevibacillus agri]MED1652588.1 DEAD/DEAH box helicase [Brevibacillus agri]MED1689658.1 DEAD/DEAH box helicase [Brevibacillus agri]MED1691104.1 DEAD/DEAH box helicase [Brevibacillus agri]MED1696786.1 DEAD/DEAH box helicase [Brevibacillus agri]
MKYVPHAYQRYCINRLLTDESLGLFLDMGLGKTVITLTAVNDLKYNRFSVGKVLVIAPKKVAEATWSKEAAKWDHLKLLRVVPVLGSATKRIRALNTPADIYVINRENVPWLVEHYRNAWPFDMVVVDEFSSFKNHQAKRFKALTWVRKHIRRIVGLTGTPAPNGLLDLWAQVYLLDEGRRLGKTIGGFRERYFEPDQRDRDRIYSYAPKPGADEVIRQLIGDICVSMKAEDYLELPDCITNTIPVVLDNKARTAYEKLEKEMLLEVDESTIDAGSAAVLTNKLLQLCNGAVYDEDRNTIEIHRCKIEAFLELVEGLNGKPALVFYNFQHDLERIKRALAGSGLRVRELKSPQEENDWNNRQIDILLAHPASAAYGLNLQQGGNHVIWFGLNWSLELYEQANKRLHRQGQTEKVIIHHLVVEGGVDQDVMAALEDKAGTQNRLMDALKARIERVKGE